jgi:2-methylcitrate dehydratase PrpD
VEPIQKRGLNDIPARGPGATLLRFVVETRDEDLPKPSLEAARLAVLDWWGVTVAGADEPVARILRETVDAPAGPASVLGAKRTAPPLAAALWNGTAAHALDYDDVTLALPGHLTAPILPGLLAAAEQRALGGRDVLTAFVLGVEVASRVARALAPGHYRAGWHATTTLGRIGGAVAAARLLGLDAGRLEAAVGLAAAQAAGIQESFGSMAKPFQVGRAAADGLLAALAAERGMTAPRGILDAEGWARRLSPTWTPERLAERLGERYAVTELIFKRYPCCFATHAAITALLVLGLSPSAAAACERVELEICPTTLAVADQREPRTGLGGKFSMTYCAAAALLRGHVREDDFSDAAVTDPAAQALSARVHLAANTAFDETRARVVVRLPGGQTREAAADLGADDGDGGRRVLGEKFRGLVAPRLGAAEIDRLQDAIGALEEVEDVRDLTRPR